MGGVKAVFASRSRQDTVILAVAAAMLVKQIAQATLTLIPIDCRILVLGKAQGMPNALGVKKNGLLLTFLGVGVFDRRIRPLVGNDTTLTEHNLLRKAE